MGSGIVCLCELVRPRSTWDVGGCGVQCGGMGPVAFWGVSVRVTGSLTARTSLLSGQARREVCGSDAGEGWRQCLAGCGVRGDNGTSMADREKMVRDSVTGEV